MIQTGKITALYARFSHDEGNSGHDSNSIANQKELLAEYANTHGFINHQFYTDDGYSGTNFERPAFQKMMTDVENGLIGTIIVKDMSRLVRNYLMVGQYTEIIFPEYNVRFVAISDNVDSAEGLSDLIPFSNLINEWYAKDISKKMRAMITQKGNSGRRLCSRAIYGYMKSPEDKEKWIIDEYAASVVRRIYELYISGNGVSRIANILRDEKIQRPFVYLYQKESDTPYEWTGATITVIITNREYCGDTVNFKTHKPSYKSKKIIKNPPELQRVFLDTHPAIIDRVIFEKAQNRYAKRCRKKKSKTKDTLFTGYVYCKDCKSRFHVFRHKARGNMIVSYECSGYRKQQKKCTYHRIDEDALKQCVLQKIKLMWYEAKSDIRSFKAKVRKRLNADETASRSKIQSEIDAAQTRIAEIDKYVQGLFEAKVRNEIDSDIFGSLSKTYTEEKAELNAKIADLILQENSAKDAYQKINRLYEAIEKYDSITELTPEVLSDFVDRIEVGEHLKGTKEQKIDVFFVGVGLMDTL